MRRFHLERDTDVSGVSGTGTVAEGVQFSDGTVAIRWNGQHRSTVLWQSIRSVEVIHGHGGATRIVWDDPEILLPGVSCGTGPTGPTPPKGQS